LDEETPAGARLTLLRAIQASCSLTPACGKILGVTLLFRGVVVARSLAGQFKRRPVIAQAQLTAQYGKPGRVERASEDGIFTCQTVTNESSSNRKVNIQRRRKIKTESVS